MKGQGNHHPSKTLYMDEYMNGQGGSHPSKAQLTRKNRNKLTHILNGNRTRGKGIKMMEWNKGSSYLENKIPEIETMINQYKPQVMGLCEANLRRLTDQRLVDISDYTLHTAPTMDNDSLQISRVVIYTHNSIVVKKRHDLEDPNISAIWLELGMPNCKKILVCCVYREWQYMG